MTANRILLILALLLALVPFAPPALAQTDDATLAPLIDALAPGNFREREAAAAALAATGDPRAVPVLQTLLDGELYVNETTGQVVLGDGANAIDPVTGAPADAAAEYERVRVNNGLRRELRTIIGQMTLLSEDRAIRLSAADSILKNADPANLELLDSALAAETDPGVRAVMEAAHAAIMLKTEDASLEEQTAAVEILKVRGGRDSLTLLTAALGTAPDELKPAI